jgi:hypothetical protein
MGNLPFSLFFPFSLISLVACESVGESDACEGERDCESVRLRKGRRENVFEWESGRDVHVGSCAFCVCE